MTVQRRTGLAAAALVILTGVVMAVEVGLRDSDTSADARLVERVDTEGPIPIELLVVRFLPRPRLATLDLQGGEVDSYSPGSGGLSREPIDGATLLDDGVAVWQSEGIVRVFLGDASEPTIEHEPSAPEQPGRVTAAPEPSALPASGGDSLWVIRPGACCADESPGRAELIHLASGDVRAGAQLPPHSRPVATVAGGLVLNARELVEETEGWVGEERSHSVLLLSEDGAVRELADGEALAATDDQAAVVECEQHEPRSGCRLGLIDLVTGERVEIEAPVDGTWGSVGLAGVPTNTPAWGAVSRHGRILLSLNGEVADIGDSHTRTRHLVVVDATGEADPTASVLYEAESKHLSAAWDARGEHVVVADHMGRHLTVIDVADGSTRTIRDAIPEDHYLLGIR